MPEGAVWRGRTALRSIRRLIVLAAAAATLAPAAMLLTPDGTAAAQTGNPAAASDQRSPIVLSDDERAIILREMRGLLDNIGEILEASDAGDRARLAAAARRSGVNGPEADHIPKSLAPKLPLEFKKLGLATHRAFDQIAHDAEQSGDSQLTRRQLVTLMKNCSSCHATWRLTGEPAR